MKYDLIEIDPPWFYNSREGAYGFSKGQTKFGGGAAKHYPLMKDKELLDFKDTINELASDNCIMFMWATMPRLDFAIELMKSWGFKCKTTAFVWIKINKDGSYRINPGYYSGSNSEIVLLGIKGKNGGKFKPSQKLISQIIAEPIREHSRKPDEVYRRIGLMYPELKKISVFAREGRTGFDSFGNEVNKFDSAT